MLHLEREAETMTTQNQDPNGAAALGFDPASLRAALRAALERAGALSDGPVSLVIPDPAVRLTLVAGSGLRIRGENNRVVDCVIFDTDYIGALDGLINAAKSAKEREAAVVEVQAQLLAHTKAHGGSMTQMALSGARGNIVQLMKIVSSPLATWAEASKRASDKPPALARSLWQVAQ